MLIRTLLVFALSLSLYACAQKEVKLQGFTLIDKNTPTGPYVTSTDGEHPKTTAGVIKGVKPATKPQNDKAAPPQGSN